MSCKETKKKMGEDYITIDVNALREDLLNDSFGAFFVGGFGGASCETSDIENASDAELVDLARKKGMSLFDYQL